MSRIVIIISIILVSCNPNNPNCYKAKVVQVGGCNKDGKCSYINSRGKIGMTYFPVVGQIIRECPTISW